MKKTNLQNRNRTRKQVRKRRRTGKFLIALVIGAVAVLLIVCTRSRALEQGVKALEKGQYTQAVEKFQTAIQKEQEIAEAWRGLGIAYFELEEYENAVDAFGQVLESDGEETVTLYRLLGLSYQYLQEYEKAAQAYEKGIALGETDDTTVQEMCYNEVVCFEKQQDWQTAKEKAALYVEKYPDDEDMAREYEFLQTR